MKRYLVGTFFFITVVTLVATACTVKIVNEPLEPALVKITNDPLLVQIKGLEPAQTPDPQDPCTDDTDCDGLHDSVENSGLTLYGGAQYAKCGTNDPREDCLDPDSRDLFIIFERSANSLIPTSIDPFEYLKSAGLDITFHVITLDQVDEDLLYLNSDETQKAVLVKEDSTATDFNSSCVPSSEPMNLGETDYPGHGTPIDFNSTRYSEVRTKQIVAYIDNKCSEATTCTTSPSGISVTGGPCALADGNVELSELNDLDYHMFKYVIAHEVGHQILLTWKWSNKDKAWHHNAGVECIMQDHIEASGTNPVVFDMPAVFDDQCKVARRVWEEQ